MVVSFSRLDSIIYICNNTIYHILIYILIYIYIVQKYKCTITYSNNTSSWFKMIDGYCSMMIPKWRDWFETILRYGSKQYPRHVAWPRHETKSVVASRPWSLVGWLLESGKMWFPGESWNILTNPGMEQEIEGFMCHEEIEFIWEHIYHIYHPYIPSINQIICVTPSFHTSGSPQSDPYPFFGPWLLRLSLGRHKPKPYREIT